VIDEKFTSITISFPEKMIKFLDEEGVRKDMNRSQVVRAAVREYQEKEGLQTKPPVIKEGK